MAERLGLVWAAIALDWVIGDPRCCHPVRLMGLFISGLERLARACCRRPLALKVAGAVVVAVVVAAAYLLPFYFLLWLRGEGFWLAWVSEAILISSTVAARSLAIAGRAVYRLLAAGKLPAAREAVSCLVGRDTDRLSLPEVVRAAVETVAENTVDGVTAPLFYAFLGGAPLAMGYRAINTLDSMLGYRNERYRDFGWAAAKLDDLANYIPARLTGCLLCLAAFLLGLKAKRAWQTMRRDARRHPSPNGGFPEAAVAGALGIRLGGTNFYGGVEEKRPYLGEPLEPLAPRHILLGIRLMLVASALLAAVGSAASWLASIAWGHLVSGR